MKAAYLSLLIFLGLLQFRSLTAQVAGDVASLEAKLITATEPQKIKILNQLAELYLKTNPEKAISLNEQAIFLVKKLSPEDINPSHHRLTLEEDPNPSGDFSRDAANAYNNIGKAYYSVSNYPKAIREFKNGLAIAENSNYAEGRSTALEYLLVIDETPKAENGKNAARWDKALKNKLESLRLGQRINDGTQNLGVFSLEKIAALHEKSNNYNKAIEYHLKTLRYYEQAKDNIKLAAKLNHIADLYKEANNYKDALKYYDLAMKSKQAIGDSIGVASSLNNIKNIYDDLNDYSKATQQVIEPIPSRVPEANRTGEIKTDIGLLNKSAGTTPTQPYVAKGDYKTMAENYAEKAENFAAKGDYKNSYEFLKLSKELENKSREVEQLQDKQKIQQLDLNKKELQLNRQLIFRNSLIGGIVLILALAFMFYRQFYIKRKAHEQLEEAYEKLDTTFEELKSMQTQLIQSEKMASLGQLTAGIAHEINNPINFVSANIQPLKRDVADVMEVLNKYEEIIQERQLSSHFQLVETLKKEREIDYVTLEIDALLSGIEEGAKRTTEVVKGLRDFSRLEESDIKPFDIHQGLDSTLALLRNKVVDRIEIIRHYGDVPLIEGFPGKINQVFMNIINNSIQAIPEKGLIRIRTASNGNTVQISISDSGTGMAPEVQNRIFEPFFTTKDVGVGTGLGLSISFGIIEQHKGHIQVKSEPGKGTEFIITLPITYRNQTRVFSDASAVS